MLVRTTWKVWGKANCFSAENQSFGPSRPLKRAFCGTSDTTPSPRVPQKALFKGREGQKGTDFQPKNSLPQPRTFHVVLTNMIGCFFILVKGFCNSFFFYLIPYGSLKTAANIFEIPGSHLWQIYDLLKIWTKISWTYFRIVWEQWSYLVACYTVPHSI